MLCTQTSPSAYVWVEYGERGERRGDRGYNSHVYNKASVFLGSNETDTVFLIICPIGMMMNILQKPPP